MNRARRAAGSAADLLEGTDMKTYPVAQLGSLPNREAIARRVSPLEDVLGARP